jgi:predicted lipoprotein
MIKLRTLLTISFSALLLNGCKKDEPEPIPVDSFSSRQLLLSDVATNVISASYRDLTDKSIALGNNIETLIFSTTTENLNVCKTDWKALKSVWAQCEGLNFGPSITENANERINKWPLNKSGIDSIMALTFNFSDAYVNDLDGNLKGLQAVEYLLFGANGNKTAAELTQRELLYLNVLLNNIQAIAAKLSLEWKSDSSISFFKVFVYAGDGSSIYSSQVTAFELLANALINCVDKMGGNQANELYNLTNQELEVIPYSGNTIKVFKDQIQGIKNVYIGSYLIDGKGLETFVNIHNSTLNGKIKQQLDEALAAFAAITVPFGEAVTAQASQIQTAITRVNTLKTTLKDEMLPLIKLKIS